MFRRFIPVVVVVLVIATTFLFFGYFQISGLSGLNVTPRAASKTSRAVSEGAPVGALGDKLKAMVQVPSIGKADSHATRTSAHRSHTGAAPRLRIGTFNLHAFNGAKAAKPHVVDIVARIVREFDVLAVQEIESESDTTIPRLVQLINRTGQQYDYAIGERVGPAGAETQFAFIFNRQSVVLDRSELYTIDDRDNLLAYEPFVAWFRARGATEEAAFTFSLVNVQVDPSTASQELDVLAEVLFAVREDGRNEDDVILLGDLQARPGQLGSLDTVADIGFAIANVPTNVEATATLDNLVFQKSATSEFTGDAGVFDFLRQYNLDLEDALEVSDHVPVWAEFTVFEGGEPGRIASSTSGVKFRR